MQRHRSSRSDRPRSEPAPPTPIDSPRRRRGTRLLVLLVVGLVALGVVGERLTRPREAAPVTLAPGPAVGRSTSAVAPIAPARPDERTLAADAAELAESLARDFPADGRALAVSGRLLQLFVDSERARTRFQQATTVAADEPEAWLGLAEMAWHDSDYPRAAASMARLDEVAPRLAAEKSFVWVDSLVKAGDGAAAVTLLERLGAAGGGEAALPGWAQVQLGQARAQAGDHAGAVAAFERVARDPAHRVVAAYGLAQAWARLGATDRARQAREAYAALQEDNLAEFDRAQAVESTAALEEKYPVLAGYHCEAGSLYARSGRFDEAAAHWRRAAALAPQWPEPRRFLEALAAQEGR